MVAFLIGVEIAKSKFPVNNSNNNNRTPDLLRVLLLPFLIHGIYDFCTMFVSSYLSSPIAQTGSGETSNNDVNYIWMLFPLVSISTVILGGLYARIKTKLLWKEYAGNYDSPLVEERQTQYYGHPGNVGPIITI